MDSYNNEVEDGFVISAQFQTKLKELLSPVVSKWERVTMKVEVSPFMDQRSPGTLELQVCQDGLVTACTLLKRHP